MKSKILVFCSLLLWFSSCQETTKNLQPKEKTGRGNDEYVKALMTQYLAPNERKKDLLPLPPIGISYLSVGAVYKGDSLRILLNTVKELVDFSIFTKQPTDSTSIVKLVKGKAFLVLDAGAMDKVKAIKPIASIDSVKAKGKVFFINYYFEESGMQKENMDFPEQAYLIDILSNWGMLISFDDYIGFYRIERAEGLK